MTVSYVAIKFAFLSSARCTICVRIQQIVPGGSASVGGIDLEKLAYCVRMCWLLPLQATVVTECCRGERRGVEGGGKRRRVIQGMGRGLRDGIGVYGHPCPESPRQTCLVCCLLIVFFAVGRGSCQVRKGAEKPSHARVASFRRARPLCFAHQAVPADGQPSELRLMKIFKGALCPAVKEKHM